MQFALVVIVVNAASSGEEEGGLWPVVHLGIIRRKGKGLYFFDGVGCSKQVL